MSFGNDEYMDRLEAEVRRLRGLLNETIELLENVDISGPASYYRWLFKRDDLLVKLKAQGGKHDIRE